MLIFLMCVLKTNFFHDLQNRGSFGQGQGAVTGMKRTIQSVTQILTLSLCLILLMRESDMGSTKG